MKNPIKLLKIDELPDGTQRLQSQLLVGTNTADFIEKDGVMKCYGNGKNGFDFYPYEHEYTIVSNKTDMIQQILS